MTANHGDTFDDCYRRAGLAEKHRDAWVTVLLAYPRDRDRQNGFPTGEDRSAAIAALKADDRPRDHDEVNALAWRLCVEREGARLLDRVDAIEVGNYVTGGGTLAEARAYLDAVTNARTPRGEVWNVWTRFEVSFNAGRFELYRQMGVSPEDLAWFASTGAFGQFWDVQRVHLWRLERCPGAPFRVAASYRMHDLSDADIAACERRRTAGEDVVAALETLSALTGDTP